MRCGSSHHYDELIRRWRVVARELGTRLRGYGTFGGYDHYYLQTRGDRGAAAVYFSAGIHGDESAATEALVAWAEENVPLLRSMRTLIFPCLNPWGLVNNSRLDAEGRDLNRTYHDDAVPATVAHRAVLAGRLFDLALTIHEDYDAPGYYIYEVPREEPHWGERMIRAAARHVPIDTRAVIEGREAVGGIVRRAVTPDMMPTWPEAFALFFHHAHRVFTIETPSECHIDDRVAAHVAVIEAAVGLATR
jgi:hypothetical protein